MEASKTLSRQEQDQKKIEAYQRVIVQTIQLTRAKYQQALGYAYGGDRDVYTALGYTKELTYADYNAKYQRNEMASAVIDRPVHKTWKGNVGVVAMTEDDEGEDSTWNEASRKLWKDLKLKNIFIRADKLSQLGEYGVLMMGFSDVTKVEEFKQAVDVSDKLELLYVKPYQQESAQIAKW